MKAFGKVRALGRLLLQKNANTQRVIKAKDIAAAVGTGIAIALTTFILLCLFANFAIGRAASDALISQRDNTYETIERPWIAVSDFRTDGDTVDRLQLDSTVLVDYLVKLDHGDIPANEVFHLADARYDVYYLVSQPKNPTTLLLVNMTYPRFLAHQVSGAAAIALFLVSSALLLRSRYQRNRRAAQSESMEAFFVNATHELKTPLAAIQGYTEAVCEQTIELDEAQPVIAQAADAMAKAIDDIMKLGKIDSGIIKPHMLKTWDVREIVYDSARLIEASCHAKGIELRIKLPQPLYYYCDPDMMYSVFNNLMANAVRHGRSFITIRTDEATPTMLVLRFENDGEPISDVDLPHLFERFHHGSKGETGIGLAYAKELLELQGFSVQTLPSSEGAAFIVRIEN